MPSLSGATGHCVETGSRHGELKNQWSGGWTYGSWILNSSNGIWRDRHVIHNTDIFSEKKGNLIRYNEGNTHTQMVGNNCAISWNASNSRCDWLRMSGSFIVKWCEDPFEYEMIETQMANSFSGVSRQQSRNYSYVNILWFCSILMVAILCIRRSVPIIYRYTHTCVWH